MECSKAGLASRRDVNGFRLISCIDFCRRKRFWPKGIARETVERSLEFAVFRCTTATRSGSRAPYPAAPPFAYLGDVFVLAEYRGRGLSKWLMKCVMSHPELQGLCR